MKDLLEDIKTFLIELVGLLGGILWGFKTNWEYEPSILVALSFLGIVTFIILKILPTSKLDPSVELEMIYTGGSRNSPGIIPHISPKNEDGNYVFEGNGKYLYEIEHNYDLVIRNNSIYNAYNLRIYVPKNFLFKFVNDLSPLEPLTIDKPRIIKMKYRIVDGMSFQESEIQLANTLAEKLKESKIIAEFKNENRKTLYSFFTPLNSNQKLNKKPKQLNEYRVM